MILTNKTLEHFLKWKVNNKKLSTIEILDFKHLSVTSQNALIIEFFDSIKCSGFKSLWSYCFGVGDYDVFKDNWNEHIQQAIKKANDIYNNTDKV